MVERSQLASVNTFLGALLSHQTPQNALRFGDFKTFDTSYEHTGAVNRISCKILHLQCCVSFQMQNMKGCDS